MLQSYDVQYDLHREKNPTHLQTMFQHIRLKPSMGYKFLRITVAINVLSPLILFIYITGFTHQLQFIHSIYLYKNFFLNTRQRLKAKVTSIYSDIPECKCISNGFYSTSYSIARYHYKQLHFFFYPRPKVVYSDTLKCKYVFCVFHV